MNRRLYGTLPDGRPVHEYTLDNGRGLTLRAIEYGGIITELNVPDAKGQGANVILGFATLDDYVARNDPYFGALVGRYANRIANGRFTLDGEPYLLAQNDGPNSLHGGPRGFSRRLWTVDAANDTELRLSLVSEDGDEHFPGRLEVKVRYALTAEQAFVIDYEARADAPTPINLTHHNYFNLRGSGSALDHELTLACSRFLTTGPGLIPNGIAAVPGTPFDFRGPQRIGARICEGDAQLLAAHGYDHCFILDAADAQRPMPCATLRDPASGRTMDVLTTEPAVQFYSGNFLDGSLRGSGGQAYRQGDGVCLETQHYPDSPNHPEYPSTVLRPGETYKSTTVHRFRTT
ncbi:aldose epimerase family protein [Pelomonas sp. KK5]|uniref:aldose epimerase family protein n=1 Tax=Pelomonas sp. KK5 TaxID=1855730 RepID=UPI00097CA0D7|nr:aldose epimerase family protein [Pelomonas sp. KK5]